MHNEINNVLVVADLSKNKEINSINEVTLKKSKTIMLKIDKTDKSSSSYGINVISKIPPMRRAK